MRWKFFFNWIPALVDLSQLLIGAPRGKKDKAEVGAEEDHLSIYMPKERLIFHYFDGTDRLRSADPMVLHRKFMAVRPELLTDLKAAESEMKRAPEFRVKALATMHSIFDTKSFDQGGLTDLEIEELLDRFLDYCASLKKNPVESATSAVETSSSTSSPDQRSDSADPGTKNT